MPNAQALPEGMPVFSNDGAHLGHVAGVDARSGWFKVNAPQAPDFWLALEEVKDTGPRYILLKIGRDQVRHRKWEGPEPEPPAISAQGTDRDPTHRNFGPGATAGDD